MTSNDYITFAGVKFHSPIANSMRKLNLINPSSIQSIAIAPVMSGLSCIIHAETGQGKTLTYLLPLLKRLSLIDQRNNAIPQSIIIVPTKELAIQVTSDIFSLINDPNLVHLCIQKQTKVLDEVDRLLEVLGKYATGEDKSKKRKTKYDKLNELQVIAASATVGRPLRRELQKILNPSIDVATVVGMLKFWNIPEVINLQESLGIQSDTDFPWKRQNKDKAVKNKHTISHILATATENKLGNANRLLVDESNARKLYITTVESARGLHIQDLDVVFISHLPYIMDEYLHMAGRTGRIGNKNPNGVVVSVVDLEEYKRLQSWQSPLGIEINFK
eukprot:gene16849-22334_t